MRFKEPTLGKGMREIFSKRGKYSGTLVDEFGTSANCHKCVVEEVVGRNEKFQRRPDPWPWKAGETRQVHGLLKCKTCKSVWNRDRCASLNIRLAMVHAARGEERPVRLRRGAGRSAAGGDGGGGGDADDDIAAAVSGGDGGGGGNAGGDGPGA